LTLDHRNLKSFARKTVRQHRAGGTRTKNEYIKVHR
jgi:hypothetical protein